MSRTIRTKVYKFNELPEKIQQKVLDKFANINVDHEWWDMIYMDANEIGLKIESFDIRSYCNGEFSKSALFTATEIIKSHGNDTPTYKKATSFIEERNKIIK